MSRQQQELRIFGGTNEVLPNQDGHVLVSITHTIETSPQWLVNQLDPHIISFTKDTPLQDVFTRFASCDEVFSHVLDNTDQAKSILVEGLEVILHGYQDCTPAKLQQFTKTMARKCQYFFVVFPVDVKNSYKHDAFIGSLFHMTSLHLALRPLTTGRAKDVSGVLSVTRGCVATSVPVEEKEFVYLCGRDGVGRLYYR